jgi:hypothetical protein
MLAGGKDGGDDRKCAEPKLPQTAGSRHRAEYSVGQQSAETRCQGWILRVWATISYWNRHDGNKKGTYRGHAG